MTYTVTHKNKLKEARSMLSRKEVKEHVLPFRSARWVARKDKLSDALLVREDEAAIRREASKVANIARHESLLSFHRNTKAGWPYPDGVDVL